MIVEKKTTRSNIFYKVSSSYYFLSVRPIYQAEKKKAWHRWSIALMWYQFWQYYNDSR